ncbi:MAG: Gfo/Idh/MocA family protein [Solirubrobacteraceae bacterium]
MATVAQDIKTKDGRSGVSGGDRPVSIAVVGAGYWGANLVRNAQQSPFTDLTAVCDVDADRARAVCNDNPMLFVTSELDSVLADPRVESVAVATPASTHVTVAMAAIEAGKHVLVEKPLASTYAEGLALARAAEDAGVVLMCDHTYCYTPAVQRIRELVQTDVLGEIQFVDSVRINLGLVQRDVNVLWDLAPHDLSILDFVLPQGCLPLAAAAHGADPIGAGQACVGYLTLQLPGGAIAHVHANWLSPIKVHTFTIGGSKRTLVWDDLSPSQRIAVYDRGVDLADPEGLDSNDRRQAFVSYRAGDMVAPALPEREALQGVLAEFADCIVTGRVPQTDGWSGLRILDILEASSRSLEFHGSVVPLRGETHHR